MRIHVSVLTSLTLALSLGAAGVAVAEPPEAPGSRAGETGQEHRAEQAREALATVERLFAPSPRTGSPRAAAVRQEPDATIALRDLRLRVDDLPEDEREDAERWFLRPSDSEDEQLGFTAPKYAADEQPPMCSDVVCVHWVAEADDAENGADEQFVEEARNVLQGVHDSFVAMGYRAPKSDLTSKNNGGDGRTDVYLADLLPDGLYGYCTTDDPDFAQDHVEGPWDASAYCVLDNDYAGFPANTETQNLKVTAAHEYFHAIQFAYDATEDGWLMEGTAAWAEDELFDGIDDNRMFLVDSPLSDPHVPLDLSEGQWWYGTWIWFRYLSEQHGGPSIIKAIWNRVDSTKGAANDRFSTQGVKQVLKARGLKLERVLSQFHADNRHPADRYEEGKHYPAAPLAGRFKVRPHKSTGWKSRRRDHLSAATVRFTPAPRLKARNWRLRLNLDLPPKRRGSAATVKVYKKSGKIVTADVTLNRKGDATIGRPFSRRTVKFVELTLTNGSARYDLSTCWPPPWIEPTPYACGGAVPRDENLRLAFRGTSFRR